MLNARPSKSPKQPRPPAPTTRRERRLQAASASPTTRLNNWVRLDARKRLPLPGTMSLKTAAREKEMVKLVSMRAPHVECVLHMHQLFGMQEHAVHALRLRVEKELRDLERESTVMNRQRAVQRLLGWLAEAAVDRSWNAVHGLENVLAKLQGTYEPQTLNVNVDGVIKASVEAVVSGFTTEQLESILATGELPGERPKQIVETTAEVVPAKRA